MGGAATNSGINYQQRIAALVLVSQYSDFDLSPVFGMNNSLKINTVHFETDEPIDDLKIVCVDYKLLLQIKRSLTFQTDENSEFYKTLMQFINQYINKSRNEAYILVTSPQTSRTITQDFNKIIESIRLNDESFKDNPLNKSEKETYIKYKDLFYLIYEEKTKSKPTERDFIDFSKNVFISVVDIEKGRPNEQVALLLLKSMNLVDPNLLWGTLITNSLEYARNRQSLNKPALDSLLNRYIKINSNETGDSDLDEMFKTKIIEDGRFSVAKEVLLIEPKDFGIKDIEESDYLVVELFRFDDEGNIKHTFQDNKLKLDGASEEITVLHRSATFEGMTRHLMENEDLYKDKKIAIIPANDIDEVENTVSAQLHRKYLQSLQDSNKDVMKCLHCEKTVNRNNSLLIEVDDLDTNPALGLVHGKCARQVDRVLGLAKSPNEESISILDDFDFKSWAKFMMKGQGLINQLRASSLKNKLQVIAWSSEDKSSRDYGYCLKYVLIDGPTIYVRDRGKIHRFKKSDAEKTKNEFNLGLEKSLKDNNPLGYTSKNLLYGNYNQLIELMDDDETFLEVKSVEIYKYSKLQEKDDQFVNFYSPVCLLLDKKDKSLLNLGGLVPIISDPLTFENIFESWKNLGLDINIDELEFKIIESDAEFDEYMRFFFSDGMKPVLDPVFNKKSKIVKGDIIEHLQELEDKLKSKEDPQTWKKGDFVRLELPSYSNGNCPKGVILEEEFIGENGKKFVLFQPIDIEKGEEPIVFSVPSEFLVKLYV